MKFGPVPVSEAEGAMLAHAVQAGRRYPKAHRVTADDIADFRAAGIEEVIAATLEPGDLEENEAATRIAAALDVPNVETRPAATGRVNPHARKAGLFVVDKAVIDEVNAIDPAITLATLADKVAVEDGRMVATVKIIPFAVSEALVEAACAVLRERSAFAVHPYTPRRVAMIQTTLPSVKDSVLAKTVRVTADRLARSDSTILCERRCAHEAGAVAGEISGCLPDADMVLVFGASALCDFDDVIPAAIRRAGGEVVRAGMPVDPGNLLVLGRVDGKVVIGAPGCARSPKENGFDWVLDRLMAGFEVTSDDIAGMGVGGLLMEIAARPQPRDAAEAHKEPVDVHAIVLAAGRSSRMGGPNKLLARFDGVPLIRRIAQAATEARTASVTVVTGHQSDRVREALDGLPVRSTHNAEFASGLAGSLKAGIDALPSSASGALVMLGDMPEVGAADIDRLMAAFVASGGTAIVRATHEGKRGNPVILPRSTFAQIARLEGDTGARAIIESGVAPVIDVEIGRAASLDVDTVEAMRAAGGVIEA